MISRIICTGFQQSNKLMQILDIRDPLAHDHYVTPEEMAASHLYCEELLRMEMHLDV